MNLLTNIINEHSIIIMLQISFKKWSHFIVTSFMKKCNGFTRLLKEGLTANLGNEHEFIIDHAFIINEYYLHCYEAFRRSPKQSHDSLCSKWTISFHCEESCSSNMVSELCPKLSHVNKILKRWTKVLWASIKGETWMKISRPLI